MKGRVALVVGVVVAALLVVAAIGYVASREPARPLGAASACAPGDAECERRADDRPAPPRKTPNSSADYQRDKD